MNVRSRAAEDLAPFVVVVGSANVDLEGRADSAIVAGESCPGTVHRSPGGVGRNIAHRLAGLDVDTRLITALGNDTDGSWLRDVTTAVGVDLTEAIWSSLPTAQYVSLVGNDGELLAAVNATGIVDRIDPDAIRQRLTLVQNAEVVVADCNLSAASLELLAAEAKTLFVDPVSLAKSTRISGVLHRVHTIKPNRVELGALAGVDTSTIGGVEIAAARLIELGVKRIFVSLGGDGVWATDGKQAELVGVPSRFEPETVASVTGAGDAMVAGLVAAYLRSESLVSSAEFAIGCATAVLQGGEFPAPGGG